MNNALLTNPISDPVKEDERGKVKGLSLQQVEGMKRDLYSSFKAHLKLKKYKIGFNKLAPHELFIGKNEQDTF